MRANQRGWMLRAVHGTTSPSSRSKAASGSPGAVRRWAAERFTQRRGVPDRHRRRRVERRPVLDQRVDDPVAEPAHVLGREFETSPPQIVTY